MQPRNRPPKHYLFVPGEEELNRVGGGNLIPWYRDKGRRTPALKGGKEKRGGRELKNVGEAGRVKTVVKEGKVGGKPTAPVKKGIRRGKSGKNTREWSRFAKRKKLSQPQRYILHNRLRLREKRTQKNFLQQVRPAAEKVRCSGASSKVNDPDNRWDVPLLAEGREKGNEQGGQGAGRFGKSPTGGGT